MNSVREEKLPRWMWRTLIFLCALAALVAIRRMTALVSPPKQGPPQLLDLDRSFSEKAGLTLVHIVPGLLFVILIPFQFSRTFRNHHLNLHRWIGRTAVVLGIIIGISAFFMVRHPVGGIIEASATIFFDCFFLVALVNAFLHIRRREVALHREWMIRAMSIALGIATTRPVMGLFFATSRLTGLTPHQFFGFAFSIGFSTTYLTGEAWIRHTRRSPPAA